MDRGVQLSSAPVTPRQQNSGDSELFANLDRSIAPLASGPPTIVLNNNRDGFALQGRPVSTDTRGTISTLPYSNPPTDIASLSGNAGQTEASRTLPPGFPLNRQSSLDDVGPLDENFLLQQQQTQLQMQQQLLRHQQQQTQQQLQAVRTSSGANLMSSSASVVSMTSAPPLLNNMNSVLPNGAFFQNSGNLPITGNQSSFSQQAALLAALTASSNGISPLNSYTMGLSNNNMGLNLLGVNANMNSNVGSTNVTDMSGLNANGVFRVNSGSNLIPSALTPPSGNNGTLFSGNSVATLPALATNNGSPYGSMQSMDIFLLQQQNQYLVQEAAMLQEFSRAKQQEQNRSPNPLGHAGALSRQSPSPTLSANNSPTASPHTSLYSISSYHTQNTATTTSTMTAATPAATNNNTNNSNGSSTIRRHNSSSLLPPRPSSFNNGSSAVSHHGQSTNNLGIGSLPPSPSSASSTAKANHARRPSVDQQLENAIIASLKMETQRLQQELADANAVQSALKESMDYNSNKRAGQQYHPDLLPPPYGDYDIDLDSRRGPPPPYEDRPPPPYFEDNGPPPPSYEDSTSSPPPYDQQQGRGSSRHNQNHNNNSHRQNSKSSNNNRSNQHMWQASSASTSNDANDPQNHIIFADSTQRDYHQRSSSHKEKKRSDSNGRSAPASNVQLRRSRSQRMDMMIQAAEEEARERANRRARRAERRMQSRQPQQQQQQYSPPSPFQNQQQSHHNGYSVSNHHNSYNIHNNSDNNSHGHARSVRFEDGEEPAAVGESRNHHRNQYEYQQSPPPYDVHLSSSSSRQAYDRDVPPVESDAAVAAYRKHGHVADRYLQSIPSRENVYVSPRRR